METGKSNMKKNLKTLGDYEADKKFMVATNRQTEIKLNEINQNPTIQVFFVKDFLAQNHS